MKALLKNNFYSASSNIKMAILFNIVLIFCSVIGSLIHQNSSLLHVLITIQCTLFVTQPGSALQLDTVSKWNRFEITMPIKRADVINARYLSFLLYGLIGLFFSSLTIVAVYLTGSPINLERAGLGFTFGLVVIFMSPAFMYPLILKFGTDKSDFILVISMILPILGVGLFSVVFSSLLTGLNENLILRFACIVFSIFAFIISYFISLKIYKKKEL